MNQTLSRVCPRCEGADESVIHVLRNCPKARAVLILAGLVGQLLDKEWDQCIDWLEDAMCLIDMKAFESLIILLWNIWNNMNNLLFRGKEEGPLLIWERTKIFCDEFCLHKFYKSSIDPQTYSEL